VLAGLVGLVGAGAIGVNAVQVALKPPLVDCPPHNLPDMGASLYNPSPETTAELGQYQASHRDEYAGQYLASDAIVEAVTGHVEEHRRAYDAILKAPGHLKMIKLKYPEWQIKALMERISNDRVQLQRNGIQMLSISGMGIYQHVELQISDQSSRARAILRDRYDTDMLCLIPIPTRAIEPPAYDPNGPVACGMGQVDPSGFFPQDALRAAPPPAEQLYGDAPGAALRDFLVRDAGSVYRDAKDGWKVLNRRPDEVRYGHQRGDTVDYVAVIGQNGGPWKWMGGGDCRPHHPGTTSWQYSVSMADPATLVIRYLTGICGPGGVQKVKEIYVDESSDRVVVAIIPSPMESRTGMCNTVGITLQTQVKLKRPLGNRTVLDGGPIPPQPAEHG
jgi:hypothetical protein